MSVCAGHIARDGLGGRGPRSHLRLAGLLLTCALACLCLAGGEVRALKIGEFKALLPTSTADQRLETVGIVQGLQRAISDEGLQKAVAAALQDTTGGFDGCKLAVFRCNTKTWKIEEVWIEQLAGGTVRWSEFPKTVKRIYVIDSIVDQPLVLNDLPMGVEEFTATNVSWKADSAAATAQAPAAAGEKPTLRVLRCNGCHFGNGHNPSPLQQEGAGDAATQQAAVDLRHLPRSVQMVQVTNTTMPHRTVKEILESTPASVTSLNISFSNAAFTLDMLASAPATLQSLDVSGLHPAAADVAMPATKLEGLCKENGFNPTELYMSTCGLSGVLPALLKCTRLKVLDLSSNALEGIPFGQLSKELETLHVNNNTLRGTMPLAELPPGLLSLDVSHNMLSGPIDIAAMPKRMAYFDISFNRFNGTVSLTQLPESSRFIYIQHNNFTGEANLVDIPLGIRFIMIHHNSWDYRMPAP